MWTKAHDVYGNVPSIAVSMAIHTKGFCPVYATNLLHVKKE